MWAKRLAGKAKVKRQNAKVKLLAWTTRTFAFWLLTSDFIEAMRSCASWRDASDDDGAWHSGAFSCRTRAFAGSLLERRGSYLPVASGPGRN